MSNKLFSLMAAISTLIILIFLFPPVIALVLCLTLIKNKPYKKPNKKKFMLDSGLD